MRVVSQTTHFTNDYDDTNWATLALDLFIRLIYTPENLHFYKDLFCAFFPLSRYIRGYALHLQSFNSDALLVSLLLPLSKLSNSNEHLES